MFMRNKAVAYGKIETTPYTAQTDLADADFNVSLSDLSYSIDIAEYRKKILDGTFDFYASVKGKQSIKVSFKVDLTPGYSAAVAPLWAKLLRACRYKQTAHGSTGISWALHAGCTHVPITLEIEEIEEGASPDCLKVKIGSAMGEVSFSVGTVGEPIQMNFEFTGVLLDILDANNAARIDLGTLTSVCPPALLSATVEVNSVAQDIDSLEFKSNNDVQLWTDPSKAQGLAGAYVNVTEPPTVTLDPYMKLLATEDWYAELIGGCDALRCIQCITSSTPTMALTALKAQLITVAPGERGGATTAQKTFICTKSSGNDALVLLQGSVA